MSATSRLEGLRFADPHRPPPGAPARSHEVVPAGLSSELADSPRALDAQVAGAGRMWSLEEWVRATHTTSLVVVDRGTVVHEWDTLGCTSGAAVATDGPGGAALAGGGLAATARDWARIGMLQVDGTYDGRLVLDAGWVERAAVPSQPFLAPGRLPSSVTTHAGFGLHWWPLDAAGRRVTADGSRGQFTFVDRETGVVVVKTSQWPYDDWLVDRQSRDLSYLGLVRVAEATVRARRAFEEPPRREVPT